MDAFVDKTQERVSGQVRLKLYKGNVFPAGTTSPFSLYQEALSTFGEDEVYNQADAGGFINCFGLPLKVVAQMKQRKRSALIQAHLMKAWNACFRPSFCSWQLF